MLLRSLTMTLIMLLGMITEAQEANVVINSTPHHDSECSAAFVRHVLPHTTTVTDLPVRMFESNGSGLGINDLNNDGLLDIVLANLDGEESILLNEGGLRFQREPLDIPGRTRAVALVDVDGDSWQDIVVTTQRGTPLWYRNRGSASFVRTPLPGVTNLAYALNWGDPDADGDLDLVTGSYDAELQQILSNNFLFGSNYGVFYYENQDGQFQAKRLSETAQALVVFFTDLTGDNRWDIAIGNDFLEPDHFWTLDNGSWHAISPFPVTTYSTMSMDAGDIDNDGDTEFYAADMHPYSRDAESQWQPVMAGLLVHPAPHDNPQMMENVLQTLEGNQADMMGINYTGWSWSSKFGDVNSDGFLDLYVVNGMIAADLFGHLPEGELVEENQAFRSIAGRDFEAAPEWKLNATESGRGMSMADLDGDGDLDIVVNNLMSPALLFENQLCGGNNLTVTLEQPSTGNTAAIGAQLALHTSTGIYWREIRALSGYLSGDPPQAHFGIPFDSTVSILEIRWPNGTITRHDQIDVNTHIVARRSP